MCTNFHNSPNIIGNKFKKMKREQRKVEIRSKNCLEDYKIGVKLMWRILKLVYMMISLYVITKKEPNTQNHPQTFRTKNSKSSKYFLERISKSFRSNSPFKLSV